MQLSEKQTNLVRPQMKQFCKLRNKVVSVLHSSKRHYFTCLNTNGKKQFWKAFKVINKKQSLIPTLVHDSVEANSDKEKAEMLSTYFAESWNTLVPPLCPEARQNSDVDPSILDGLLCTEEEECHLLENLNVSKAAGLDGISAQMLKDTASVIAPSLSKLFNRSLSQGCFPACWKLANVIPVPKSGSLNSSPSGYRPISLLCIISKVLEKHVYMFMHDYLSEHYPIASNQ